LFAEGLVGHGSARDPDHREPGGEAAIVSQPIESGEQFALGEVAVGAENDDCTFRNTPFKPQRILERILDRHRPKIPREGGYSYRKAITGSTRVARRAGPQQAATAAASNTAGTSLRQISGSHSIG